MPCCAARVSLKNFFHNEKLQLRAHKFHRKLYLMKYNDWTRKYEEVCSAVYDTPGLSNEGFIFRILKLKIFVEKCEHHNFCNHYTLTTDDGKPLEHFHERVYNITINYY